MAIKDGFLAELEQEAGLTRRFLERVPEDRFDWKPHDKSMALGRLAAHLAELPGWTTEFLDQDEFDVEPPGGSSYQPPAMSSVSEIIGLFDTNIERLRDRLNATSDEEFRTPWTLKKAGAEVFTLPRAAVVRSMILNHLIHHRAQLGVFLRLNDVPVPGSYGPSADEPM